MCLDVPTLSLCVFASRWSFESPRWGNLNPTMHWELSQCGESGGSGSRSIHNRSLNGGGGVVESCIRRLFLPASPSVAAIVVPSIQHEWVLQHKQILILNTQMYHRGKLINTDHRGNREYSSKQKHLKMLVSKADNSNIIPPKTPRRSTVWGLFPI